ncbi:MAG: FG-GAP-like repeat-containing protein [Syntrophobacteraceae bacterium]
MTRIMRRVIWQRFTGRIGLLAALLWVGPAFGAVNAPVLKWQNGGCYSSWCETGWYSSVALADLDNDGKVDVVGSAYSIVALDGATGFLKWRVASGHDLNEPDASSVGRTWPGIVIADVDHDGQLEIITAHSGSVVSVLGGNGMFKSAGWPWKSSAGGELRSLSVGDLDGNGKLEIVVGRASGSKTNTWVLDSTGKVRSGWPRLGTSDEGSAWGVFNANIALGDLDGDELPEIVAPSDTITICAYRSDGTQLATNTLYHGHSGHDMNFWGEVPAYVDLAFETQGWGPCYDEFTARANFAHGPANVVDVNGDGTKEVVAIGNVHNCHTNPYTDLYNTPYIFNADRSRFNGGGFDWTAVPINTGAPLTEDYGVIENAQTNPVTVDLDGDGRSEILYASYDGKVHCFWLDKTEHGRWPYSVYRPAEGFYRFASEPVVADLDSDGYAEVIFASWTQKGSGTTGKLHILDYLGNVLHEVDLPQAYDSSNWNGALAAPTLGDIDGDGELEVVLNTAHSGFVAYDLPGASNARVLWGTGRGSYLRDGGQGELPPVVLGPDLAATWQQVTVTGPDRRGYYRLRGKITVSNRGNQASPLCLLNAGYTDQTQVILKRPLRIKKLNAGQSTTLSINASRLTLVTGGSSELTAFVDAANIVNETNESNNQASYTINLP